MSQPHWKMKHSLGDRGMIYEDTTGVYPPEAELWEEYEDERGKTRWLVYRFSLEQKSFYKGHVNPYDFHKRKDLPHPIGQYAEWYDKDLASVARSAGTTKTALIRGLTSKNIMDRFWAYESIAGYHGLDNFDSYPLNLSEKEFEKRTR